MLAVLAVGAVARDGPVGFPRTADAREYSACMRIARSDPKAAHESALAWQAKGGGDAAVHCIAVALLGFGQYRQAARMLEELAARTDAKRPDLKAGLYGQAADAWLIDGVPAMAERLLTEALAISPEEVDLLIERAIARGSLRQYWEALDDLNLALEKSPDRADALTFRASAWRQVNSAELARQDIDRALDLRPDFADALLERGLIRETAGDREGARADWLRILDIAADSAVREAARHNLERMDVKKAE